MARVDVASPARRIGRRQRHGRRKRRIGSERRPHPSAQAQVSPLPGPPFAVKGFASAPGRRVPGQNQHLAQAQVWSQVSTQARAGCLAAPRFHRVLARIHTGAGAASGGVGLQRIGSCLVAPPFRLRRSRGAHIGGDACVSLAPCITIAASPSTLYKPHNHAVYTS